MTAAAFTAATIGKAVRATRMTARESLTVGAGAGAVVVVGAWLAAVRLLVAVLGWQP